MKLSFTAKIKLIIILLFIISLIQGIIIFQLTANFTDTIQLKLDIQNTVYITLFLQFVLALILIFYIPIFLNKAFSGIHQILKEISKGTYSIDIDTKEYRNKLDKEFYALILSIKKMLESILKFDLLKKDKIIEHHNRITALLNLTEDGFIIFDIKGNIVYLNDLVTEIFPSITEKVNMIDSKFPPEIENNIKKYIVNVLKNKTKSEAQQFFAPSLKKHIFLNSGMIRDNKGEAKGVVVALTNLDRKKAEKTKELEI